MGTPGMWRERIQYWSNFAEQTVPSSGINGLISSLDALNFIFSTIFEGSRNAHSFTKASDF